VRTAVESIARKGGTPLVVADRQKVLGVIHLKDVVKGGIKDCARWSRAPRSGRNSGCWGRSG
jgi:K+-transporting ATPase ATPase B chain